MSRALGRYELLRPLARGGMAEVYLARRRAAGVEKWLVVKRMRPERAGDARFLDLFVREARLSMSLAHQNIVPVFDFGRIDDQVFIAMERIEGRDLGSTITKNEQKPLSPLLAAFIAAECCQALDYAHKRKSTDGTPLGIVHRDVTPRNVLLSWSGEVKLTDFGIAALAGDEPMKMIGTPAYMAPEQARGESLDLRADIYALGMVLREALTGKRPRPGDEKEVTLAAARAGTLAPWPDGFDSPLCAIADRATSLDPAARYPSAHAMLEELDTFMVAERAARKGDGPGRQLAAWLTEIWKEERDERDGDDWLEPLPGNHLVSFLDDGSLDVIGTGTVRSMAVTSSEVGEPATPSKPAGQDAPAPAPRDDSQHTQLSEPPVEHDRPAPKKRAVWWLAGSLVVAGAAGAIAIAMRGDDPAPQPLAAPQADVIADLSKGMQVPPVAPPQPPPPVAQPEPPPPQAPPVAPPQPTPHPRPRQGPRAAPVPHTKVKIEPPPPTAPAVLHKVVVGFQPGWAFFTIDGDPTKHTTIETVKLGAGTHHLHFWNPETLVEVDKDIVVPDDDSLKIVARP